MKFISYLITFDINLIVPVLLFPHLLGGVVVGCFGRFLGKFGVFYFILFLFLQSLFYSINLFCELLAGKVFFIIYLTSWFDVGLNFEWNIYIDMLSTVMILLIVIISFCVIIYSFEYLNNDPHFIRFISYMLFFVFFMLLLVTSGNLVQLFIGWEGVGIISYLLVNFWFTRIEANRSAIKAVIFNKIGDIFLMMSIIMFIHYFKTVDITNIIMLLTVDNFSVKIEFFNFFISFNKFEFIALSLFASAMSKSAQIGLHAWLPDAMEGPTPVSALLHSATMVTAGIFLVLRFAPLFNHCKFTMSVISVVGALTAFFGALFALFQYDIKKIIALSTCSQLGLMFTAFGMYNPAGCLFHLVTHAFFKALLFLTAGCIIHALNNEQDIRKMGGLFKLMPLTFISMLIGFLGLIGFPFISGFYSKEFIIVSILKNEDTVINTFIFCLIIISSLLTILYSCKILFRVFFIGEYKSNFSSLKFVGDSSFFINFSLTVLSVFTIFSGYLLRDLFTDFSISNFCGVWLESFDNFIGDPFKLVEVEITTIFLKYFFLMFTFIFLICIVFNNISDKSLYINIVNYKFLNITKILHIISGRTMLNNIFHSFIVSRLYRNSYVLVYKIIERGLLEFGGPLSVYRIFNNFIPIKYDQHKILPILLLGIVYFIRISVSIAIITLFKVSGSLLLLIIVNMLLFYIFRI